MIHIVKGFSVVNEEEVDVFMAISCFFYDQVDVCNLIYASSAFSKSSFYILKFSVHLLLKPSLKDFEHYFASMWNECNCAVVWTFFGIGFCRIGMKTDLSLTLQYCIGFAIYQNESATGIHVFLSPPPSSLHPPCPIPLGRLSAPAPSIQYCASNLDWRLVSYMISYIFQCHSPKSSHPLPLPQSPKDCSIHQCLFCCLVHRVIVTIFLNSIY